MGSDRDARRLPDDLEEAVLRILDGDEAAVPAALANLMRDHADHAEAIRDWLSGAGVPMTIAMMPTGITHKADALPRHLGDYRLLAIIGRGGFGTVYRAEQQQPIRRPVAVKLLNPGMDSREILARFTGEREALNRMDHPGIARLLDAGSTPEGRPYFVMELVDGPTLLHHCRNQQLALHDRLRLFLDVLDAVQHAHQKALVHRDLSANNVLVATAGARPQPKIIDFGVAKSLADPLLLGGAMTMRGTLMGTPEYMSPEQAAGNFASIDTRTDVYSLGVQLYELLTGLLPIPSVVLRSQGVAGMAKVIVEYAPPRASDIAPAAEARALRGDLDAILGKALSKDVDDRYATVAEFASDLRRHLAHEPVQVASPSRLQRLGKFVRRNRAASIAMLIAAAAMIAATVILALALRYANDANERLRLQGQQLAAKANAGFRLLANEERLRAAELAATQLPPPWPEHAATYELWHTQHAQPLRAELQKTQAALAQMRADANPDGTFADPADQHLLLALTRLRSQLQELFAHGAAARVDGLRGLLRRFDAAQQQVASLWQQTASAVKLSDGKVSSRAYAGIGVAPQAGIVPLGIDPNTGLAEFLDLASHPPELDLDKLRRTELPTDHGIVFVLLPPGSVRLGASRDEPGLPQYDPAANDDELHGETVWLDAFLIAKHELTVGQWSRLLGVRSETALANTPVTGISWQQATAALQRLGLDLPTEAQWEYACRAGTTTPWSWGEYAGRAAGHAHQGEAVAAVGSLAPNAFGLFDMHGNVAEWCRDAKLAYGTGQLRARDGLRTGGAATELQPIVVRGGTFARELLAMRSSARNALAPDTRSPDLGVRPVRRLR